MRKKIEIPKVFISYAWGSDEYQNKVLAFASQLSGDGVEVVIDKWDLTEGNDTYSFMEKCASDPSITNVLMLLDPVYANKADKHAGGVGTETQIISPKVYREVNQDKFIPIVMARDDEGKVCKPTYLEGRLHFDLSLPEKYDMEYKRLVKKLYGEETYVKPELGKKPDWVEKPLEVNTKSVVTYSVLKNEQNEMAKKQMLKEYLDALKRRIWEFSKESKKEVDNKNYIECYDISAPIKEDFLQLVKYSVYIKDAHKNIADFLEDTENGLNQFDDSIKALAKTRIHELFLYTVAHYLKYKDYLAVGHLLGKTYFDESKYSRDNSKINSYEIFYSGRFHEVLDNTICERDKKKYYTGTGQHWIETLSTGFCSKEQFILADLICFNYSIYGKDYINSWPWFPITYVYDNEYNSSLNKFAQRMISKEYVEDILPIFGFQTAKELTEKMKSIEESPKRDYDNYRYAASFEAAPLLKDFIKAEQIATVK